MALQLVNRGSVVDDVTAEDLFDAFGKVNSNTTELEDRIDVDAVYDFGADPTGATDSTTELQSFLDACAADGLNGYIPAGTYDISDRLLISSASGSSFQIRGHPTPGATTILRNTDFAATMLEINRIGSVVRDLTLNAQHDTLTSGNHGFASTGASYQKVIGLRVLKHKNTAILINPGTGIEHVEVDGCYVDGNATGNNGILIDGALYSGIRRSFVKGCPGSPGYALQLKNSCQYCYIENSFGLTSQAGVALGQDISATAVTKSSVRDVICADNVRGIVTGYAEDNTIDHVWIEHDATVANDAIRLQNFSLRNTLTNITVRDVGAARFAVRFESDSADNFVHFSNLIALGGKAILFAAGAGARNSVHVSKAPSTFVTPEDLATDSSGLTTNIVEFNGRRWPAVVSGTVIHGATAGTARPAGFVSIIWIGSVEPTNATENDIWINTA